MMNRKGCLESPAIISMVADYLKVPVEEILGKSRKKEFVKARHLSMYFIEMFTDNTLNKMAEPFTKDHDDIIYARRSINNQAEIYRVFRAELDNLRKRLVLKTDIDFEIYKSYDTDKT